MMPARSIAELVAAAIAVGFIAAYVSCRLLLPVLRTMRIGQQAYEDAPQTHQAKTGTATLGGLCFVIALIPTAVPALATPLTQYVFALIAACAGVGFIDDVMAIRLGRNRGLRARTKFLLTALLAVTFLRAIDGSMDPYPRDVILSLPGFALMVPHWLWLLLGIAAITGTIHAVNLTDGLDGLAAGSIVFPLAVLSAFTAGTRLGLTPALGIGACLGFLVFNRYPAKLIMGDTGSLALGALFSGVAILSGQMLLLVVIGGVFVAEAASVMLQVTYFKLTGGKRIFRMSPLHHHFEMLGWPETKVTARFWIASAICSAVGWAIAR